MDLLSDGSLQFALRVGIAAVGGMLIGFERDVKGKNAGMRTNILVAMGAALFALVALRFKGSPDTDFLRVIGQIVTGVGFLGAGVIMHRQERVKGLSTAATIWCSAGIGCLAAASMFAELLIFVVLALLVNFVFGMINIGKDKSPAE